jgi:hypothetical protein
MTLGIAASNSTREEIIPPIFRGVISVRNMAAPTLSGVARRSARIEDTTEPKMKGRAPNSSSASIHCWINRRFRMVGTLAGHLKA